MSVPAAISDERFVLAFHGFDASPTACEEFFRAAVIWFTESGYPPDKMSAHDERLKGKVGSYARTKAKVDKRGFADVKAFSLYATMPEARIPGSEYFTSASFSIIERYGGYAILAVPFFFSVDDTWMHNARKIVQILGPSYGMGFKRQLSKGPDLFALGLAMGLGFTKEEDEEALKISRWGYSGMVKQVYREGILREVFPWNFLTRPQLDRPVGNKTLEQWIGADPSRGKLSPFAGNVFLWEVVESQIASLSAELQAAGAIFDWRKTS